MRVARPSVRPPCISVGVATQGLLRAIAHRTLCAATPTEMQAGLVGLVGGRMFGRVQECAMKGWRVAVVAWPIDGESRPRGLEGKLEGIGAWIEARGRPASVLVQEVVHGGHDVLVVYGRPADVGAIAEALDGAGSGGLQVLALPTGPMAALCADIGLEGDVGEVLGRVVRLSKMEIGRAHV